MTDRIIDIKTGRPKDEFYDPYKPQPRPDSVFCMMNDKIYNGIGEIFMQADPPYNPPPKSYDEMHAELCASVEGMLSHSGQILAMLIEIAGRDEKLLRSIRWQGGMTIPVALRPIRSKLTWLEDFFKREPRR